MSYLAGELPIAVEHGERVDVPEKEVGVCHLTNYRLGFQGVQSFDIPLKSISKLSQEKEMIHIHCKDSRLFIIKIINVRIGKLFFEKLKRYAFPSRLEDLFAFQHGNSSEQGEGGLNLEEEYNRCCLDIQRRLRLYESTRWHPDYPSMFVVHVDVSDGELWKMEPHRDGHVPVVMWAHPATGAVLVRCGQPGKDRCPEDDKLIAAYCEAAGNNRIAVVDVRTPVASWGKQVRVMGVDYIDHKNDLSAGDLGAVRKALESVFALTANNSSSYNEDRYFTLLDDTRWLSLLKQLLEGSSWIADKLAKEKTSVVVYCQEGSDRTPQLTSLAQILLDPHYRTIQGFALLVEKEWVQFGHKFASRVGHKYSSKNDSEKERSPIFIQFLHAVWQLTVQFPHAFEFNELFLLTISDHVSSCRFGTFLCDNAKERAAAAVHVHTRSLWDYLFASSSRFQNPLFNSDSGRLVPRFRAKHMRLWETFFLRYDPAVACCPFEPEVLPIHVVTSDPLQGLAALSRQKHSISAAPENILKALKAPWHWASREHREQKTSKFFEVSVEDALQHSLALVSNPDPSLPAPVAVLLNYLEAHGLDTPGLFRTSADGSSVDAQVTAWKKGEIPKMGDVEVAADVLKRFFRMLPQPLIPPQHYLGFVNVARTPASIDDKKTMYRNMVASIPEPNGHLLRCLVGFLARVAARANVNQMNPHNLAVCWAPNLLWSNDISAKEMGEHAKLIVEAVQVLIADASEVCQPSATPVLLTTADPGQVLRISVIGNTGVGKQTLINSCAQGKILVDGTRVLIEWSTECGPRLHDADVVLACFNLQYYPSYFSLMAYAEALRTLKKPTVLVGLQSDSDQPTVHFNVEQCVQEIAASSYRCCSASTGEGALEVVQEGVRQALAHAKVGSTPAVQIARLFQTSSGVEISLPGANALQLRNVSFPLKDITKKWMFFAEKYLQPSNDPGPRRALHGALAALKNLAAIDNKQWQEVLPELHVGLIKATSDCGNTSVSMGLASTYFARYPAAHHVALLNFGTGGVRFQLYTKNSGGIVSCLLEYKPPGRDKGLLSKLAVGSYDPEEPVRAEQLRKEIEEGLQDAPWSKTELKLKFKMENVPVYAFITGPLRNHWENHPEEAKLISDRMHALLVDALGPETCYSQILGQGSEYLIPQQLEGAMELVANRVLYRQYSALTGQKLMPIVSLGVGKGSSQWTSLDSDFCLAEDYSTYKLEPIMKFGMDCVDMAERLGSSIVHNYQAPGKIEALAGLVLAVRQAGWIPVIALKSGCLLPLDEPSSGGKLRKSLVELDPPSGSQVRVLIRRREQALSNPSDISRPLPAVTACELPRCLPLACAKATQLLRRERDKIIPDFLRVELEGHFLSDLSGVPAGAILVFWTAKDLRALSKPAAFRPPPPLEEEVKTETPVLIHTGSEFAVQSSSESKNKAAAGLTHSRSELTLAGELLPDGRKIITFRYGEEVYRVRLRPAAQKLTSVIARLRKVFPTAHDPTLYYPVLCEGSVENWFPIDSDETLVYALNTSNKIECLEQDVEMI